MPAAIRYIPPTDNNRWPMMAAAQSERARRGNAYNIALEYYQNDYVKQLENEPGSDDPDFNVGINLVKMTADRTASFLFPSMPEFEIDNLTPEPTDEERWVKNFYQANGGLVMLNRMATRGFLSGHTFIRVSPRPRYYRGEAFPTLSLLEPTSVTAYWKADDVGEVLWYEQRYMVDGIPYIQDHVNNGLTWTTFVYRQETAEAYDKILDQMTPHGTPQNAYFMSDYGWDFSGWVPVGRFNHPYWVPPIIEWAHLPHPNDYYGMNEFSHQDLLDTINRLWSEISRIVHIHSDPKDVIIGSSPDDFDRDGDVYTVDNQNAKVTRLTLASGSLSETLETVRQLHETYLALSRVVLLKGEAKDLQRVTNASVRTLFLDALSKNNVLQSGYGQGLSLGGELAIKMSNLPTKAETLPVIVKFPEALPTDMNELANVAAVMNAMHAWSLRTIRVKTGVDPVFEQVNVEQEQEQAMERQRAQMEMQKEFAVAPVDKESNL